VRCKREHSPKIRILREGKRGKVKNGRGNYIKKQVSVDLRLKPSHHPKPSVG
jgi:hypothetical protein